jgi:hypothetical protein
MKGFEPKVEKYKNLQTKILIKYLIKKKQKTQNVLRAANHPSRTTEVVKTTHDAH